MTIWGPGDTGKNSGIPIKDYGYGELLYNRLPAIYRVEDAKLGQDLAEVERQLPDLDTSSVLIAVREEYQLQRFLRILGAALNVVRSGIEATLQLQDIDKIEAKWLPDLAKLLGWNTNLELSTEAQRDELRNAIDLYKRKGRQTAIEFLIEQLTDFDYEFRFGKDRLLVTQHDNEIFRINADSHLADPAEADTIGDKDDENYYSWGQRDATIYYYGVQYVYLYLTQNLLNPQSELLVEKISRISQEFLPWGIVLIVITDSFYGEPDYETELKIDEWYQDAQTWKSDHQRWLQTWAEPEERIFAYNAAGHLADPDDSEHWRLWFTVITREEWETNVS
jgi:phage tail-like protein